jgi:hypothetical protein
MPARYLSDTEFARLGGGPGGIADEDTVTYFTLSADDLAWLAGFNREENRLGVAVQLATLPWLGWILDDLANCPVAALTRLGARDGDRPGRRARAPDCLWRLAGRDPPQAPGPGVGPVGLALVRQRGTQAAR